MQEPQSLQYLGVGLGFRKELSKEISENPPEIELLELISDHYLDNLPGKKQEALELTKNFPIVLHGLELSLGTDHKVNEEYLNKLGNLVDLIQPGWASDHLCFTGVEHQGLGTLTPLPFNRQVVDIVVKNIKQVAARLSCPFLIENISYLFTVPPCEMSEAEFITSVLEESDSYLLLDITNVLNNATNAKYDAYEFLDQIPLERVVQIHLAGGKYHKDLLLDSHDSAIPDGVFDLLKYALPKTANLKGIIIERDQNFPPIEELFTEMEQVRAICRDNGFGLQPPAAAQIAGNDSQNTN
jgi:uncharacterized protein (UPF0276 family)